MIKKDIIDLIYKFEMETWKFKENDDLDKDMQYIYSIENEISGIEEAKLRPIYEKLNSMIGIIRFKYGFESMIIKSNPELESLNNIITSISLNSDNLASQYNYISTVYQNYINKNTSLDLIKNSYENKKGQEGLYLAVESLKSLITNSDYRQLLDNEQIRNVIIDCVKLNNGIIDIKVLEFKYKEIIGKIWKQSLTNSINNDGSFRFLFSNISGGDLRTQAQLLINRPNQSSCSMISSKFIATYGSNIRKIGFIYPNNSEFIMAGTDDLCSNVFSDGVKNKEKGTLLATPEIMEKIGIAVATKKGEDNYSSSAYNEVLINSKPCGIVVIGLGEKDLNIEYQESKMLSLEMNLPIYYIDTMKYKNSLSESDRYYIAFHSVISYLDISSSDVQQMYLDNSIGDIYALIDIYKDQITDIFLSLKKEGNLNKENMCQAMRNIIDMPKINGKSK